MRRGTTFLALTLALTGLVALPGAAAARGSDLREVLYVGNNWDGTANVVDPLRFKTLARMDIVPDLEERMAEIAADPVRLGFFLGIRELVGEGHDQFVDDMFGSKDGRFVYVSRPSLADVVGIELGTGEIAWRVPVDGYRADHMAISPDGKRLLVSASTAGVVDIIDPRKGVRLGSFRSGSQPHESNYSKDGTRIFHASIGSVFTPTDQPFMDASKGERIFEIVDAETYEIKKVIDMGEKLDEFGEPDMSGAIRPMTLSPDERFLYFQVSFFHGFVEYDLKRDEVTRLVDLPLTEKSAAIPREQYVLDSAHHGLSMNPQGTRLCAAGTMSDYAAIVQRDTGKYKIIPVGPKPYWSTNSGDGDNCFVSVSGDDRVAVISYKKRKEIASVPVGDHPQRMRIGDIAPSSLESLRALRQ